MTAADNDLVEVRLLNLPVEVQRQAAEHHDALIREFELIRVSESSASIPARLVTLIDELQARYEGLSDAPRAVIEAAIREGAANVDVTYLVPAEVGEAMLQLNDLLEKADEYCRAGEHLVTLATPPLISGYRRWFIDEFVNQARGRAPEPWRDAA
ncbi:MAG TPA: hypothetical protein VGZ52_05615, partial [Acidimicrobiales bacterium]|nr:hypothetical protein [Acidimicrobiales bacterium]